jgi:hypothetical protein
MSLFTATFGIRSGVAGSMKLLAHSFGDGTARGRTSTYSGSPGLGSVLSRHEAQPVTQLNGRGFTVFARDLGAGLQTMR